MDHSARLLIVDDEPTVLNLLVSCLEDAHYLVDRASGVGEALRLIDSHAYDVAVVDKNMRGVTNVSEGGIEIVNELAVRQPACKVLVITGYPDEAEMAIMLNAGACAWMAKPFTMTELERRVAAMLGSRSPTAIGRNAVDSASE